MAKKTRPMLSWGGFEIVIVKNAENVNSAFQMPLGLRLGFWKADWAFPFFPLPALFEQLDALKTLENRTLSTGTTGCFE